MSSVYTVTGPGEFPRAPYQDSLLMGQYQSIFKLVPTTLEEVAVGDVVALQDSKDRFIQFEGEKILVCLKASDDGSLSIVPYAPLGLYKKQEVPPYTSISVDKEELRTLSFVWEDSGDYKKISKVEQVQLDPYNLLPNRDEIWVKNGEDYSMVPMQILKAVVDSENSIYKATVQASDLSVWALQELALEGSLYLKVM